MKKKILSLIVCAAAVLALCVGTAGAAKAGVYVPAKTYSVTISGKALSLSKDAAPYIVNGRLMVPAREVAEALGYTISWNAKERCAVIENKKFTVSTYIGEDSYARASKTAIGMTEPASYGAAPAIKNGRTFVPVRMFSLLGYTVTAIKNGADISTSDSTGVQLPNPMVSYKTAEEAAKAVSFQVKIPAALKDKQINTVNVISGDLVQLDYADGTCYRVSGAALRSELGTGDISGDYNEYSNVSTITVGGQSVTLKGDADGVLLAVWGDDANSFSIAFEKAVTADTVSAIVASVG